MHEPAKLNSNNIAEYLPISAAKSPFKKAIIEPVGIDDNGLVKYVHYTFKQLEERCSKIAHGLHNYGIQKGHKVLLMVTPSLDFLALTYALYRVGAIPVLIDPGMGKSNLLDCIEGVQPDAMVAIPKAHLVKLLFPSKFKSVKHSVIVGKKYIFSGKTLNELCDHSNNEPFEVVKVDPLDMATMVFTTGSTGTPKGVVYFHKQMQGQVNAIAEEFSIGPEDIDFPVFPLFALFSTAWGITAVIPEMDPTKPSKADPLKIIAGIEDHGVTMSIGSPALWEVIGTYAEKKNIKLNSLKQILMVGAPVRPEVLRSLQSMLDLESGHDAFTPYGATESLPVANISATEILNQTFQKTHEGHGTCIGRAFPGMEIQIIEISDDCISNIADSSLLKANEIGEIIVKGTVVTKEYFNNDKATSLAKIADGESIWHRMGDVGYKDDQGRLWFCGRKAHRVDTETQRLFSVCTEAIFNQHSDIYRSALVGVERKGSVHSVMIVQPIEGKFPQSEQSKDLLRNELFSLATQYDHTKNISNILFHEDFPVDIRHNAKIFREKLSVWAADQLQGQL
ncbi:MAG: AMP-binding protein [Candidatus Cloacimonetes bacterium]|nr:AMP-binding protein [Candidatus Cloacimonadota bacterium]